MTVDSKVNPGGPRLLTQRNLEKRVLEANGIQVPRPDVGPGMMQLFSYYKPSLTAGNYFIHAEQYIQANTPSGKQALRVWNWKEKFVPENSHDDGNKRQPPPNKASEPQQFEVMTPQFALDPELVNSFYPPEGHQDEGRILPHIVISDPHFPWERDAGHSFDGPRAKDSNGSRERDPDLNQDKQTVDQDGKVTTHPEKMVYRSIVPWIKLIVFDASEIQITNLTEAQNLGIPDFQPNSDPSQPDTRDISKQQANYAFSMTAGDYLTKIKPQNRVNFAKGYENDSEGLKEIQNGRRSKEMTQVVFPKKDLFYQLFRNKDTIESNKYLAHVRNVNTIGFPNAGLEENGLFSIVISGRTGAFNIDKPITQIVHLVSMEHIDVTLTNDFQDWPAVPDTQKAERIGLVSLYSWTYTALPPDPVNFIETMRNIIGDESTPSATGGMQMLRPPDNLLAGMEKAITGATAADRAKKHLVQRLRHGYTLSRWRAETGEVTAAFGRGPLVPVQTGRTPSADWPTSSTYAKRYQIFDKNTGLMDLSYSSAWQLGKMLAIADTSFNGALMRFRSFIQRKSDNDALLEVNKIPSKADIIANVRSAISDIRTTLTNTNVAPQRIVAPNSFAKAPQLADPTVAEVVNQHIVRKVNFAGSAGDEVWNEFNKFAPNNTDWTVIHQWITDKLYLSGIPAHILFPDPSFIPEESLRFFYIDDAWMDCMIDGALSVGNHLERDDDRVKTAIKEWYNCYLQTFVPGTNFKPQIPCYGFILRSQLVKCMPDLKITVNWNNVDVLDNANKKQDQRAEVCQWIRPDDHTLLGLLDRLPEELKGKNSGFPHMGGIVLSQPPHQQRFSFGQGLTKDKKDFLFLPRQLYTSGGTNIEWKMITTPSNAPKCIDRTTRLIDVTALAIELNKNIQMSLDQNQNAYIDYVPNSAEMGLELNDPAYYFSIYPLNTSTNTAPRSRVLWTPKIKNAQEPADTGSIVPDFSSGLDSSIDIPIPQPAPLNDFGKVSRQTPDRQRPPIIIKDLPLKEGTEGQALPGSTPTPCFILQIFPDFRASALPKRSIDNLVFEENDFVPAGSPELFDLIFSIQKDKRATLKNNQMLREIVVNIPITAMDSKIAQEKTDALLTPDWGGNVKMVSNQRFVPFVNWSKDVLQIRLLPRSAKDHPVIRMDDLQTKEVSFRLTFADVPAQSSITRRIQISTKPGVYFGPYGFARIDMFERYQVSKDGVMSAYNGGTVVVKKTAAEDEAAKKAVVRK